ncbi:hypothetical protein [Sphingobacterium faecium]|uniref:hypothetical protein n=1 Tax=Sphingobacterium faecium TaxID=34087 RepID=UPI0024790F75|nr:hypothetical protein [Sphingobacterium faecium]WGQ15569.1 hypothetical protein QG727_03975 [Sphingobacterium faecium]
MYHINRGNTVVWSGKAQGKQSKVIMQEDRVEITIKTPIPIIFKKGDTIKVYGETYKLNRPENIGKTNNEIGYTFTIEFEALYYDLGKWILNTLDKNNNLTEPDVHIMGEASVILGLLVQNANRTSSGWTLGQVDRTETIQWAYNGAKLLTVLQDVADQTNLEFWCVGKQINLTRKQIQTGITFQYGKGKGLYELRRDRKDKPVVTHMKVQGGTQNLPNGYGFRQIQPSGGNPMVNPNYTAGSEVVEDVMTFENVYPRLEAKVTSVQANNMIRSTDIDFNLNDHLLADGTSAQIAFTSGLLNSFKFTISEDGFDNATKQVKFNPITDENAYPDGVPNAMLKPAVGDSFVFLNINMPQSYVTAAENRVKELGDQYFAEEGTEQYTWSGKITPKFILENNIELTLGGIVNLNASDIGFSGPIRIASYTRDLEEEYLYDFTLSNVVTINYLVRLRNQSDRLANAVTKGLSSDGLSNKSTYAESAGFATLAGHANTATNAATANFASQAQNAVNADRAIIANRSTFSDQADKAALADRAFKADHADKATLADRATLANYALDADHAKEADHAKLADRANVADYAYDSDKWDGKQFADYIDQPLRTNDIVRHQSISTPAFISGATGSGWKLFADGSAEVDSLTVRKSLNVVQLNIREITGTGGSFAVTNVAKIYVVHEREDHYSCYINTDDNTLFVPFNAGDIVRCQVWDGKGIKYYVGRIRAVSQSIFDIEKPLLAGSGVPSAGDNVFQFGSSVAGRQGLIYMTNSDSGAPYLDVLDGIDSPSLEGKTKVRLGKLNGITDSVFGALSGYGLYAQNAYLRGNFWVTGGNAETQQGAQSKAAAAYNDAVVVAGQDATAKANAAKDFAAAQDNLAKVETKAYADGIVDAEEARAIADAQAKLSEAKNHADAQAAQSQANAIASASQDASNKANAAKNEAISSANQFAQNAVSQIKIGGRNLLLISNVLTGSVRSGANGQIIDYNHYATVADIISVDKNSDYIFFIKSKTNVSYGLGIGLWLDGEYLGFENYTNYIGGTGLINTGNANGITLNFYKNPEDSSIITDFFKTDALIKVEKGNKATDWTPAPEDITNSINILRTETAQSFVVMDGKIEGKVNKTDFNVLGQTVSQQGTLISQNASSIELRATKQEFSDLNNTVSGLWGRVSNAETAIQQNSSAISLRAVKSDVDTQVNVVNDRIDNTVTRLSVAELKITPEAIQQTVKSQTESIVSAAVPATRKQVSTLGLDENTYYPLIINLSSNDRYKIMIDRMLDVSYGKPIYSFHPAGFSAHVEWTTIGSGWGARQDDREILIAQQRYAEATFGSIGQVTELSQEFIYLRGGSIWDISVFGSNSVEINIYRNGYHWEAGSYSGDVPLLTFVNEVKSITSRILNSETSISQTKDEISLRATKTEVITQVSQVAATASQDATAKLNEAKIHADAQASQAQANAISASNVAISTALSALSIGGRNYYSNYFTSLTPYLVINLVKNAVSNGFMVTGEPTGAGNVRLIGVINANGQWTVSGYVRGTQSEEVTFNIDICDQGLKGFSAPASNEWTYFEHTVEVTNYTKEDYHYVDFGQFSWHYFQFKNIQVEKGNKATDWKLAPEDLQQQIVETDNARKAYVDSQDQLKETQTKAYADGKVDAAEQRSINDATAKANAAKGYADAQDALLKAQTDAYADGKVTAEESARIAQSQANLQAAKDYAAAQDALSKIEAKAYADGVVDAEEARAIADAAAKANIAQANAINAASQDATIKSNNAISASNTYTDNQIIISNNAISLKADKTIVDNISNRLSSAELKITPEAINSIVSGQIDTSINNGITIKDTRYNNNPPSWYYANYGHKTVREFKDRNIIGLPYAGEDYVQLVTNVPWGDASGGSVVQEASQAGNTYTRSGKTDSWSAWIEKETIAGAQSKANGAYNDAVAYANSQITQTKDEINLSITSKIDNITLGGRNYYSNSNNRTTLSPYLVNGVAKNTGSSPNGFIVTGSSNSGSNLRITDIISSNGEWTVSGYIRGDQGQEISCEIDICDVGLIKIYSNNINEWKFFEHTVNVTNYSTIYNFVDFSNFSWHYFFFKDIKVEKGNKATDWTPALEDVQGEIDVVTTRIAVAELKLQDDSIRAVVRQQTENIVNDTVLANLWSSGKPLNPDPTFKDGMNGLDIYNNEGTGAANWGRLPVSSFYETFPTTSGYGLYYAQNGDRPTSPGWGGFHCNTVSRAKAKFLVRMILAFEEGRNINFHSNSFGDEGKQRWLTPTAGKGVNNFTEYISYVECGNTGSFGNTNLFAFAGGNSVSVRIAFAGVYDITDAVNNYTTKQEIASSFEITSGGISIAGKSLSLAGKVTFSSLDANAQQYISDIDTLAYTANGYASNAQSVANIASGAANNALVSAEGAKNTADTAFLTANNAKNTADSANATASSANIMSDNANIAAQNATITANSALSSTSETALVLTTLQAALKGMAFQDKVDISKLDTTIIDGGYVKTTLLNVSEIFAQNITATGTITATNLNVTGNSKVGGFDIQGNKLSSAAPDTSLVFSALLGGSHVEINSSMSSPLISIRTDQAQRRGMSIQTYASEAIGLDIIANAGGRFAITSHGGHQFHQRSGEFWNAPGVLLAITINQYNGVTDVWNVSSITANYSSAGSTSANRKHVITHNLGHTDYIVHYTIASPTLGIYMNNPNIATIKLIDKSANSFEILVVGSRSGTSSSNEVYTIPDVVQFLMIGRNRQL